MSSEFRRFSTAAVPQFRDVDLRKKSADGQFEQNREFLCISECQRVEIAAYLAAPNKYLDINVNRKPGMEGDLRSPAV